MLDVRMRAVDVEILKYRAKMLAGIRQYFDSRGFVEVETSVRIEAPAPEPNIDCPEVPPSQRHGGKVSYLRASPELQMKKLLCVGMDRIYQIGPCFRDGEKGSRHNPEFTMIEWYRRDASYLDILEDAKSLLSFLSENIGCYGGGLLKSMKSTGNELVFRKLSVRDAYLAWAGWDPWKDWNQDRFDFDMATKIEPALKSLGLVFLMDYPPQAASLARIQGDSAERWELYFDGVELANCFSELCDPAEQRRRFEEARAERKKLNESDYPMDEEFLSMLGCLESAAGVALGIDRLVMKLSSADEILQGRAY